MKVFAILTLVLVCLSCSSDKKNASHEIIDFGSIKFIDVSEPEFLANIEITSLETNDECLFGENYDIFISNVEYFPYKCSYPLTEHVFSHGGEGLNYIFRESIQPIIYTLSKDKIEAYLTFNFDTPPIDITDISLEKYSRHINVNGEYSIVNVLENTDSFYFCIAHAFPQKTGFKIFHIVMSKRAGLFKLINFGEDKILNIRPAFSLSNDYLYFSIDALTLSEDEIWLDKLNAKGEISINSNPLILKWRM